MAVGVLALAVAVAVQRAVGLLGRRLSLVGAAVVLPVCLGANAVLPAHGSTSLQGWSLLGGTAAVSSGLAPGSPLGPAPDGERDHHVGGSRRRRLVRISMFLHDGCKSRSRLASPVRVDAKDQLLPTTSKRRTVLALATAVALLPAAPALAQTAPPTTPPAATPAPVLTGVTASAPVIDFGQTVDVTVRGTAGTAVDLLIANERTTVPRRIRTATLDGGGSSTWTGLRPEERTLFIAVPAGASPDQSPGTSVEVRRTVTIGVSQADGSYTFTGQLARAEAGVQVTIARLDSETRRVTGVASATSDAAGRYTVRTGLPQGLAGYYALTAQRSGLQAGRSRLYGLLVNTRPTPPPAAQRITLGVRQLGEHHVFSGEVTDGRDVPITLARTVDGRPVGVLGGRTNSTGGYSLSVPLAPGTYVFLVLTATARSRPYGLVVPGVQVRQAVVTPPSDVFYADCDAVRRAGRAPLHAGEPGYRTGLDRDRGGPDGTACE